MSGARKSGRCRRRHGHAFNLVVRRACCHKKNASDALWRPVAYWANIMSYDADAQNVLKENSEILCGLYTRGKQIRMHIMYGIIVLIAPGCSLISVLLPVVARADAGCAHNLEEYLSRACSTCSSAKISANGRVAGGGLVGTPLKEVQFLRQHCSQSFASAAANAHRTSDADIGGAAPAARQTCHTMQCSPGACWGNRWLEEPAMQDPVCPLLPP